MARCKFIKNNVLDFSCIGGAVVNLNCNPVITNCIFAGNRAFGYEVALGGGIYNDQSTLSLMNSTLYQNVLEGDDSITTFGGGVYSDNSDSVTISNSIIWGNVADESFQIYYDASTTNISHSNIDQDDITGEGLKRREPNLGAECHLQENSPCIDGGHTDSNVEDDIDGENRADLPDIGADEFVDSDNDGMPDFWEQNYNLNPASDDASVDLDNDGFTNLVEYRIGSDPGNKTLFSDAVINGSFDSEGNYKTDGGTVVEVNTDDNDYRAYFIFVLNEFDEGNIQSVVLRVSIDSYYSSDPSENISVWNVLETNHENLVKGDDSMAVYGDLGSGRLYGSMIVTQAEEQKVLEIRLNPLAIDDINVALNGSETFAVGISMEENVGSDKNIISFSDGSNVKVKQLVLEYE